MKKALFAVVTLAMSAGAFAESPAPASAAEQQLIVQQQQLDQLKVITSQLASHAPATDPATYCYFNDKAYSRGSLRDGQMCVGSSLLAGGTDGHTPLKWVAAKDAARGNY